MRKKLGALPSQYILRMIEGSFITADPENVNPASLDLSISEEIYRMDGVFLPQCGERISDVLRNFGHLPHNLNYPLEKGVLYLARLNEVLSLPPEVYAYCTPKSSTGRNDIHVRVLADGVPRYDAATPAGFKGNLWILICPKSYPVKMSINTKLSQMRFFNHDTRFDELDLQLSFDADKLLWCAHRPLMYGEINIRDDDGSIVLTLEAESEHIGWECRGSNKVLDFSRKHHYNPNDFFIPVKKIGSFVEFKQGSFYILSTREAIRVPPHLVCEMIPMDERSGDFRSHYAGFIDPGYGWGKDGEGQGRTLVLEVRPFEDFVARDNQPIAKIRFERLIEAPELHYDQLPNALYKEQIGPQLPKHFIKV